jgi:hypothetical protein
MMQALMLIEWILAVNYQPGMFDNTGAADIINAAMARYHVKTGSTLIARWYGADRC